MRRPGRAALAAAGLALAAGAVGAAPALASPVSASQGAAQEGEEWVVIELRTTLVTPDGVYVDRGSADGLEPGDRVRLFRPGATVATGTVKTLSTATALVVLERAVAVDVGLRGEVRVPRARLAALQAAGELDPDAPEHPPWEHGPVEWDEEQPLLAPVEGREPADREPRLEGRAYLQVERTEDRERDSGATFGRLGADLELSNPFERGGRLLIEADQALRTQDLAGGESDSEARTRVRRLSYAFGGTRYDPLRVEAGRFFQAAMPEFGLLDGAEVSLFGDSEAYAGVSAGYIVAPDFEFTTGEDLQLAAFGGGRLGGEHGVDWRAGYQKTWHEGVPDRDLLAGGASWRGEEGLSFIGSAAVDLYGGSERVEESGLELSELHLDGGWRGEDLGLTAGFHRFLAPDLRRDPVPVAPGEEPTLPRSDSAYVRLRGDLTDDLRLSGRVDSWSTSADEGLGAELRADWRDLLMEGGGVALTLYRNDGQLTDVEGLRLGLDQDTTAGSLWAGYELSRFTLADAQGDLDTRTRHSLRLALDRTLGRDWSLSLFGENHFGDDQDALTLGLYLQRRF